MKTLIQFSQALFVGLFLSIPILSQAQQNKAEDIGLETLDETFFFAGLSATILDPGKAEVNFYTSMYSTWLAIHESVIESPVRDRLRLSEFTANVEAYYGLSATGRWDLGLRLRHGRRRLDNSAQSSPFRVFQSSRGTDEADNVGTDKTYAGLKEVGLRFRLMPFKNIPELTLNAGYSISPIKSEEDQEYLIADRNNIDFNLSYFISLNKAATSYYYFILNGVAYLPSATNDEALYNSSASFFIVQRLGSRFVLFPGISYSIAFKPPSVGDEPLIKTNTSVLGTLGLQYQPSNNFSLNVSGALPLLLDSSNLLVQQVRESFSFVSLGGRLLF
ncbi:MAG: hypothetical protein AAF960_28790 [Bacteroidota bacterium]